MKATGSGVEKRVTSTKRLGFWIGLFLLLSVLNRFLFAWLGDERLVATVHVALLVGLFGVVVFLPSDALGRKRIIDLEAAAAALGITFWTALTWEFIADGFGMSRSLEPGSGALFILLTYFAAKVLVEARHR